MRIKNTTGVAVATAAAMLFGTAFVGTAVAGRAQRALHGRELLQGPVGLQERQQFLQGPELLQGQGLRGDEQGGLRGGESEGGEVTKARRCSVRKRTLRRRRRSAGGHPVEEIHQPGLQRVLGAHHQQPVACGSVPRAPPSRGAGDRRTRGCWRAPPGAPACPGRAGRAHRAGPRPPAGRGPRSSCRLRDCSCRRARQLLEGRMDRAAAGVTEHHHQARAEALGGELDAAHLRGGDDVARHADHEQVAQPLVEHDLRRHPRIGAAEDDRERRLLQRQRAAPLGGVAAITRPVGREALVAFLQCLESLARRDHGFAFLLCMLVPNIPDTARRLRAAPHRRRVPRTGCASSGFSGQ